MHRSPPPLQSSESLPRFYSPSIFSCVALSSARELYEHWAHVYCVYSVGHNISTSYITMWWRRQQERLIATRCRTCTCTISHSIPRQCEYLKYLARAMRAGSCTKNPYSTSWSRPSMKNVPCITTTIGIVDALAKQREKKWDFERYTECGYVRVRSNKKYIREYRR